MKANVRNERVVCMHRYGIYSYMHPQLIEFHVEQRISPISYRYFCDAFKIYRPAVSIEIDVPLNDRFTDRKI